MGAVGFPEGGPAVTGDFLRGRLKPEDVQRISESVRRAEDGTWGEIVPMIVSQSTPGRSAEWTLTLAILLLTGPLSLMRPGTLGFWLSELALVIVALVLPKVLFAWRPSMRRFFIPRDDLRAAVHGRAIVELEEVRLRHTQKRTGVLLMVSWYERKAIILGDEAIARTVPPEEWQSLVADFAQDLKAGHLSEGFTRTIAKIGEILQRHFPADGATPDEIQNSLVIKI